MLETLTTRLARIVKHVRGEALLTEANIQEALREVRIALLEADVALPVVKHFVEAVRAKALGAEVVGSLPAGRAPGVSAARWSAACRRGRRWSAWCTASSPRSWARRTCRSTSRRSRPRWF